MSKCKIVTLTSEKGGVGKTFLAFNYSQYLSKYKNKKVLLLDLDSQMNDSVIVQNDINKTKFKNSSIFRAFYHMAKHPTKPFPKNFKPFKINKNLDMFAGSRKMNTVDDIMSKKQNMTNFVLMRIIFSMKLLNKYDYIIIDTHNSFNDATINALIVSDYILVPTIPDIFSWIAVKAITNDLNQLRAQYLDMKTGKSYIKGKLYFVGNLIKFNTKASHQFEDVINSDSHFIAGFKTRELVNKANNSCESIFDYAKDNSRNEKIIKDEVIPNFNKITKVVSK